jgi:hypothetical protein
MLVSAVAWMLRPGIPNLQGDSDHPGGDSPADVPVTVTVRRGGVRRGRELRVDEHQREGQGAHQGCENHVGSFVPYWPLSWYTGRMPLLDTSAYHHMALARGITGSAHDTLKHHLHAPTVPLYRYDHSLQQAS